MSKKPQRQVAIAMPVQLVTDGGSIIAALVTAMKSATVVNLVTFPDGVPGDLRYADVPFEDDAKHANASGVGFKVRHFWRWPR